MSDWGRSAVLFSVRLLMSILAIALICFLAVVVPCALSAIVGRRRATRAQRTAFYAGVVGLLSVPACLIALCRISLQIPYLRVATPAGVLLVISAVVMLSASVLSLLALLSFRMRPRSAA